jgi:hypothetical protein
MSPNPDIGWKQRVENVHRAFVLLRGAMENGPSALNPKELDRGSSVLRQNPEVKRVTLLGTHAH